MELSNLKKYRKIVPGALILIGFIPICIVYTSSNINISDAAKLILTGVGLILSFVIGAIYEALKLRHLFNNSSHANIDNNIKVQLLLIGRSKPLSEEHRQTLLRGTELKQIFYQIVDGDESLKEKSKIVKDNGLIWTSASDVVVIGGPYSIIYACILLFSQNEIILISFIFSLFLTLFIAIYIHPKIVEKHIELGNDQLDFIRVNLKKELQKKVNDL